MTAILIAVIALIGSAASAGIVVYGQLLQGKHAEKRDAERTLTKYREPLITAAFDLQSRIFNSLSPEKLFLTRYVADGDLDRRQTALNTSLYTFAQYFGWREILREEVQLLDLGEQETTREIGGLLGDITRTFASDSLETSFLLWKAEQRAIGEAMIHDWYGRPACMGYLAFLRRRDELGPLLDPLERDLVVLATAPASDRLAEIQNLLVDLIERLDPDRVRYPPSVLNRLPRKKVTEATHA